MKSSEINLEETHERKATMDSLLRKKNKYLCSQTEREVTEKPLKGNNKDKLRVPMHEVE